MKKNLRIEIFLKNQSLILLIGKQSNIVWKFSNKVYKRDPHLNLTRSFKI